MLQWGTEPRALTFLVGVNTLDHQDSPLNNGKSDEFILS